MIELFRSLANSFVAKLLLGLLVVSFAAWGIGDVLSGSGGTTIAQVGDRSVSQREYRRAFGDELRQYRGAIDMQQARSLGLDQLVLSRLVNNLVLSEEAEQLGVDAPDDAVIGQLKSTQAFQNAGGEFQTQIYELWLTQRGMRKRDFEGELREDIARELLVDSVASGGALPRELAEVVWKRRNERRDVSFITLSVDKTPPAVEPTDEEVAAYHEAEAERFTAPEYREIAFIWVRAADRADPAAVSDAAIQARYDERIDSYRKPERRNLEQIVFSDEAAATEARQRVEDGESFTKIAAEQGYGESDFALGYVSKSEIEPFGPELAEAAFGAQSEGVVGPVESSGSWILLNIAGVSPAETTSFEDAKPDLAAELAEEQARVELPEVANAVEDLRAAGETFEDIGRKENVTTGVVTVDSNGLTPSGDPVEGLPPDTQLLERAFAMEQGEEMDLGSLPGGEYYAVEVRGVTPSALKPLDQVRGQVVEAWKAQQRRDALERDAEALVARLEGGEAIDAIAGELGADVETANGLTRGAANPKLPPELISAMFAVEADAAEAAAFQAPMEGGKSRVVAVTTKVTPADPAEGAAEIEALTTRARQDVQVDMLQLYAASAIQSRQVDIYPSAIDVALSAPVSPY